MSSVVLVQRHHVVCGFERIVQLAMLIRRSRRTACAGV